MARPLLDALAAEPTPYDTSSLFALRLGRRDPVAGDQGRRSRELLPNVIVVDGFGSLRDRRRRQRQRVPGADDTGGRRGSPSTSAPIVLDDDLRPVEPGSRRDRPARPPGPHPARLLQGRGEDGGHLRRGRRRALGAARRHGHRRRRRHDRAARPRLGCDQHRRREGVPRGGRGRAQGPPGGPRRARRRRARRAVGRAGRRRRRSPARRGRRRSTTLQAHCPGRARRLQGAARPRARRRASSAARTASPTTGGPRSVRSPSWADRVPLLRGPRVRDRSRRRAPTGRGRARDRRRGRCSSGRDTSSS